MEKYAPTGKTPSAKIRDLVNEATARECCLVGSVVGHDIVVWPNDNIMKVWEEYQSRAS